MSPRIKVLRKVLTPPVIDGFKPFGQDSESRDLAPVNILFEEYEALRLSDYSKLNHHQASVMMDVSRPTFTRIYASALQKIAIAFVEGRPITIKGGKVNFDRDWYRCDICNNYFNSDEKDVTVENCFVCGSQSFKDLNFSYNLNSTGTADDLCYCPSCGYEQKHELGRNCKLESCPECNSALKRKF